MSDRSEKAQSIERTVRYRVKSVPVIDGAGVKLKRAFGNMQGVNLDPFLLLDNMHSDEPDAYGAGFPWHPHRGIETVTYVIDGEVDGPIVMNTRDELIHAFSELQNGNFIKHEYRV